MTFYKPARIAFLLFLLVVTFFLTSSVQAQALKKVRMASSSTNVSFLALYTALNRGFFKDEGIDLEIIFMPANLASTAVLNGDVDYNGAVTGTIGAAVQGRPMKRSEEHTSELQSHVKLVCRLLLEKKKIMSDRSD